MTGECVAFANAVLPLSNWSRVPMSITWNECPCKRNGWYEFLPTVNCKCPKFLIPFNYYSFQFVSKLLTLIVHRKNFINFTKFQVNLMRTICNGLAIFGSIQFFGHLISITVFNIGIVLNERWYRWMYVCDSIYQHDVCAIIINWKKLSQAFLWQELF